jgi:hypothetical protein
MTRKNYQVASVSKNSISGQVGYKEVFVDTRDIHRDEKNR